MSFILIPEHGDDVQVNGWNWRPTLALLFGENLIDAELCERMGANGCGALVNAELVARIADAVERKLALMTSAERLLADLSVTSRPKREVIFTPEPMTHEVDLIDLYSASYEWLVIFRDFCRRSGGFLVS